ncbi:MAG TPA: SIMPL domain-containing protein [Firmicutes bacterium]|nr:SIMPL domain-containing protein [Bacillota bacterium]
MKEKYIPAAILGGLLALGMLLAGMQLPDAVTAWKKADRVVTVKGLAEREVRADLVLWPLSYTVNAHTLEGLYNGQNQSEAKIRSFLTANGFTPEEISTVPLQVRDTWSDYYGDHKPEERYRGEGVVLVRTTQVDRVLEVMPKTSDLIKEGVLLSVNYQYRPQFLFTGLNDIKPDMIAEATQNARQAAEQFAQDSGSRVGKIRSAQQGYFSIEDLDSFTQDVKKVRVVTTIEFYVLD